MWNWLSVISNWLDYFFTAEEIKRTSDNNEHYYQKYDERQGAALADARQIYIHAIKPGNDQERETN